MSLKSAAFHVFVVMTLQRNVNGFTSSISLPPAATSPLVFLIRFSLVDVIIR